MPKSEIAGVYDNSVFAFLKNYKTIYVPLDLIC